MILNRSVANIAQRGAFAWALRGTQLSTLDRAPGVEIHHDVIGRSVGAALPQRLLDVSAGGYTIRRQHIGVGDMRRRMIARRDESHLVSGAEGVPDEALLVGRAAGGPRPEGAAQRGARRSLFLI